jgi:hyperosmotically inducible periplasmic protein
LYAGVSTRPQEANEGEAIEHMKAFISFVLGVLVGLGAYWYLAQPNARHDLAAAGDALRTNATELGRALKETLDSDKIKEELARTGKVIREKTAQAGAAIADATANARITAAIKARLFKESSVSAVKIHVDTTDGVVTLSGTVSSYDQIGTAMQIALDTDGVTRVVSTLQVKPE